MKYDFKYDGNKVISASSASNDFVAYARAVSVTKTKEELAQYISRTGNVRLLQIVKTAVDAGTSFDVSSDGTGWAGPMVPLAHAFADSLIPYGAYDAIRAVNGFSTYPLNCRVSLASDAIQAGPVSELESTPLSSLNLTGSTLRPQKIQAFIAYTEELSRSSDPAAARLFGDLLRHAIATATDALLVSTLSETSDVSSSSSSGFDAASFLADLDEALAAIDTGSNSRLFLVVSPSAYRKISVLRDGGFLLNNGTIGDLVRVLPSSGIDSDMLLFDARNVAVGEQGTIDVISGTHASIALSDAQTSGTQDMVNLWQNNMTALRASRFIGIQALRSNSIAVISGVSA